MEAGDLARYLTIRHLRVIAALAELGLVARVAEALNVTQPSVSKQIGELEKLVAAPIVARERNRLHLTPIGHRLAEHARRVLDQIDRAALDVTAMASGVSGAVSVGVVSSVASILLPGAIAQFKRSAPAASVAVVEGHFVPLFPQLKAGALDLLIARTWHRQELPGIAQKALFQEPVVVVAGPDHPLARVEAPDWRQALDWPWLLPSANSVARGAADELFARHGLAPPVNQIASVSLLVNLGIMREMPALGFFPESLARHHARRRELEVLPLDTRGFLTEVRSFWRDGQEQTNSSFRLFLQCLDRGLDRGLDRTRSAWETIPKS